MHDVLDALLGLGSIAAIIGGVLMGIRATRRDHLEQAISDNSEDIAHMVGWLSGKGYQPRR